MHDDPDRFILIADIHGNADALAAVLADIDAREAPGARIVNLGDHLSGPLDPAGTAELLEGREMVFLRGNHDRVVGTAAPREMGATDRFTVDRLSPARIAWLREMPEVLRIGDGFFCHAIPRHDETYWAERVTPDGRVVLRGAEEIAAEAAGIDAGLLACGHSHQPRVSRLGDGRLWVNPGSVGCPAYRDETPVPHAMETGSADARYAVAWREGGLWRADLRAVPYDAARMVAAARAAGREDWARAVATGYAG
ncbi:metallophosphoesterase family protein [Rhodovulum sp. DZ06]|uniref:metallophosphoesterase family protein n=1 Tax=Rhodovulum sp. DZ06 TaxID=3425126 RepID=UPI003D33623D